MTTGSSIVRRSSERSGVIHPLGQAPIASVSSLSGRCSSYSEFARKGMSRASSSALNCVHTEIPAERRERRLMFAPVEEVKEASSVHVSEEEYEGDCLEDACTSPAPIVPGDEDEDSVDDVYNRIDNSMESTWLKRMLHRFPLVQKALVLVLLPVLALFIFSVIDLQANLEVKHQTEEVLEFTDLVRSVKNLTRVYLSTSLYGVVSVMLPFPSVLEIYEQLVVATADAYDQFKDETVHLLHLADIEHQAVWNNAIRGMERHPLIAKKVLAQQISLEEVGAYYVGTITSLVSSLASGGQLTSNTGVRTAILGTYYHMMLYVHWGLEMTGSLVATLAGSFTSDTAYRLYLRAVVSTDKYTALTMSMKEFELIEARYRANITQDVISTYTGLREYLYASSLHPNVSTGALLAGFSVLSDELLDEVNDLVVYTTDLCRQENDNARLSVTLIALGLVLLTVLSCGLVAVFVSSVNAMTSTLCNEVETRQRTEKAVWRFFPQEFISYLNVPDIFHLRPGDRTKLYLAVMFAQLTNFKDVSGNATAEQTYDWLTDFIKELIPIVSRHSGFVDKNTGDGILALFATPEDAVHASLEMQAKVKELNAYGALNSEPEYELGIGIHSGEVVLGLLGTQKRLEGTIISDTVNTASRVQGMCKFYGSRIVISEAVAAIVDVESLGCRCLGEVRMKGKVEALRLYDVFFQDDKVLRQLKQKTVDEYQVALQLYQEGRFHECMAYVDRAVELHSTTVKDPGLLRRREFAGTLGELAKTPEWWSGEDIFDTK